jgi:predicted DNA binding CopG/RHH family protein
VGSFSPGKACTEAVSEHVETQVATIEYFKQQAREVGLPYQTLINLYLADCAASGRKPALTWT